MNTMRIDILNPKATKLLKNLADLNLIAIKDSSKNEFTSLLKKTRSNSQEAPSLEEISQEVEIARKLRYEK